MEIIKKIQAELDRKDLEAYTRFDGEALVSVIIILGEIQQFLNTLK